MDTEDPPRKLSNRTSRIILGLGALAAALLSIFALWDRFFPADPADVAEIVSVDIIRAETLSTFAARGLSADQFLQPVQSSGQLDEQEPDAVPSLATVLAQPRVAMLATQADRAADAPPSPGGPTTGTDGGPTEPSPAPVDPGTPAVPVTPPETPSPAVPSVPSSPEPSSTPETTPTPDPPIPPPPTTTPPPAPPTPQPSSSSPSLNNKKTEPTPVPPPEPSIVPVPSPEPSGGQPKKPGPPQNGPGIQSQLVQAVEDEPGMEEVPVPAVMRWMPGPTIQLVNDRGEPMTAADIAANITAAMQTVSSVSQPNPQDPAQTISDPLGRVASVRIMLKGLQNVPLNLRWSLNGANVATTWQADNTVYRILASTPEDAGNIEVWVPDLRDSTSYLLNVTLAYGETGGIAAIARPLPISPMG